MFVKVKVPSSYDKIKRSINYIVEDLSLKGRSSLTRSKCLSLMTRSKGPSPLTRLKGISLITRSKGISHM